MPPFQLLAIALGGACGAVCRYAVSWICVRGLGTHASLGTCLVNLLGCLAIGLLVGAGLNPGSTRHSLLIVGFLGALTTFSTFSLEALQFLQHQQFGRLASYWGASLLGGLSLAALGMAWGQAWARS